MVSGSGAGHRLGRVVGEHDAPRERAAGGAHEAAGRGGAQEGLGGHGEPLGQPRVALAVTPHPQPVDPVVTVPRRHRTVSRWATRSGAPYGVSISRLTRSLRLMR